MRAFFSTITLFVSSVVLAQSPVQVKPLADSTGFTVEKTTRDLGNGFFDHGVASPISNHRGVVATVDGNGRNVVLVWLFDHRGGYALLAIDAETGKSEEYPIPFDPAGDTPYASILSTSNKLYTLFRDHFCEFDPVTRKFTFTARTMPQMAMSMTEDDEGKIWSVTYPNSGLVSFDPKTRKMRDFGTINKENWRQYPRAIAADDAGWIYVGLGNASSQIFAVNPETGATTSFLPAEERKLGQALVFRDKNGKVYGQALGSIDDQWYELYKGAGRKIGEYRNRNIKPAISGSQALFHRNFPDGRIIKELDLVNRVLVTGRPGESAAKTVRFSYTSDGAIVMGTGTAPDGTIIGGTAFPMRFFSYDPEQDKWTNRLSLGQLNAFINQGSKVYFGVYAGGYLIEWDPAKPWINTKLSDKNTNPVHLTTVAPGLIRPYRIVAHPDGKTILMGGTPQYGATGGGLLIWDNAAKQARFFKDSLVSVDQSSMSLVPLAGGKLLGGTTTSPGSGGEKKAKEAELYEMDMATGSIIWRKAVFPGAQEYSEMRMVSTGLIYGIVDKKLFFVFDPATKEVVHQADLIPSFGPTTAEQSPRIFVNGPGDDLYILFARGAIVQVTPKSYEMKLIATAPGPIKAGGDYLNGKIFFVSGSHLYSYDLKK